MKVDIREITVDTVTLRNDINDVQSALAKVKMHSESMFREIDILGDMWEGETHDAFFVRMQENRQKMQELQKVIERLMECMQYADHEYLSCEDAVHSIINTIRI
ncbi:MAG: WXG100 family type VII secretion target [Lachnospiraceae bacterium]|nr:WXG100 family type VII secretion target [Lachnospiraceae bacterium]